MTRQLLSHTQLGEELTLRGVSEVSVTMELHLLEEGSLLVIEEEEVSLQWELIGVAEEGRPGEEDEVGEPSLRPYLRKESARQRSCICGVPDIVLI